MKYKQFFYSIFCHFWASLTLLLVNEILHNLIMVNFRYRQNYDCLFMLDKCLKKNTTWSKTWYTVTFYSNYAFCSKKFSVLTTWRMFRQQDLVSYKKKLCFKKKQKNLKHLLSFCFIIIFRLNFALVSIFLLK